MGGGQPGAEHDRVAALTAEVRRDLARIAHPRNPWLEPRIGPDGKSALDVLIIGAGQSGLAIAFALMRAQDGTSSRSTRPDMARKGPG